MSAVISSVQTRSTNISAKSIALPVEHGAWGFLFEPLVAAILIAPSVGAPWIALLYIAAFLARQPLKFLLGDWQAGRNLPRTRIALRFALIYSAFAALGLAGGLFYAPTESFLPLVALAPFVVYLMARDVARQTRQLLPEIIGATALSSSAVVLALAANWTFGAALAIWAVMLARLVPSILYVRARLRLAKGKEASAVTAIGAHHLAIVAVAVLAYLNLISILPVLMMAFLTARAIHGLSPWASSARAKEIGIREVIYGVFTVISVVLGFHLYP
jgi:hypothetical protein